MVKIMLRLYSATRANSYLRYGLITRAAWLRSGQEHNNVLKEFISNRYTFNSIAPITPLTSHSLRNKFNYEGGSTGRLSDLPSSCVGGF